MKLFQKKEPREIKEDDSLFVKIWYNKRYHAIMSLSLYFIFFLIIIILVNVSSSKNSKDTTINGTYTQKYFESLGSKDISYNYIINQGNKTYYFSGINKNDGVFGNILYNGESTTVKISDGQCYVGSYVKDSFVESDTLCPENINYKYFDTNYIYSLISDVKGTKNDSNKQA